MTDEEIWKLRGILSQVNSVQTMIIDALADRRLTENRVRDIKRALSHILEQVDFVRE